LFKNNNNNNNNKLAGESFITNLITGKITGSNSITGGSHTVALGIHIKKLYLKAKEEELWKLKIFHHSKNIIFKKSSKRKPKSFQDIITLYNN